MDLKQNKKDFEIKSRVETTRKLLFNLLHVIVISEIEIIFQNCTALQLMVNACYWMLMQ